MFRKIIINLYYNIYSQFYLVLGSIGDNMKIKTRLILFNILIIAISSFAVLGIFDFIASNLSTNFYSTNSITVDDNVVKVKEIINTSDSYNNISNKLKKINYDFYVYDTSKNLIYGNSKLADNIIEYSDLTSNQEKTIFVNNATGYLKVSNNKIYLALETVNRKDLTASNFNADLFFKEFIILSIMLIIFVLFVAVLFSNIIIKRIMKPIADLTNVSKKVKLGNYDEIIEYKNKDEFLPVITSFNEMQSSLKEETLKNEQYEKAKKEMLNGINHDIRTPLTAVKGHIKGIQDGIANTKKKQEEYLNIAYNRTLDIENLLNKLFDTFNYETGEIKLNKTKTNIEEFIRNYFNSRKIELKSKNIEVNINRLSVKEYLYIDKTEFSRIFENLLNNAIKYSNSDPLIIEINIWKEDNNLKISFKDNGVGVKEENLSFIFDEFFKEDKVRKNSKENGSGLGLFIVKTIVESHGGTIIAKNKKGLYFEITMEGVDYE